MMTVSFPARLRFAALALIVPALLAGCGSSSSSLSSSSYSVYGVLNRAAGTGGGGVSSIQQYKPDSGGNLSTTGTPLTFGTGIASIGLAFTPNGRYAATTSASTTSGTTSYQGLAASSSGDLSTTGITFGSGDETPSGVAFSPDGRFAYSVNSASSGSGETVQQYTVGSGGTITATGTPLSFSGDVAADGIAISPNGTHAYVLETNTATNTGQIQVYTVASDGTLAALGSAITLGAGKLPLGLRFSPGGGYGYVLLANNSRVTANTTLTGTIQCYSVGSDGALTVNGSPISAGETSAFSGMVFSPDGTRVYAAEVNTTTTISAIQQFEIGSAGALNPIGTPITFTDGSLLLGLGVRAN